MCIIIQESKDANFCSKPKHVGHHQSGYKFHWYDSCRDSCSALISLRIFAEESLQVFLWHPKVWEQLNRTQENMVFHNFHIISLSHFLLHVVYVYVIAFFIFFIAGWTNMFLLSWFVWEVPEPEPPKSTSLYKYIYISSCWFPTNFAIIRYPVPSDNLTSQSFYSYGAWIIYRWSIQRKKNSDFP